MSVENERKEAGRMEDFFVISAEEMVLVSTFL